MPSKKRNSKHKYCSTPRCSRIANKGRTKCEACRKRAWCDKYPIKSAYANLKTNAKRRGKVFTLTLEDFEMFCERTDYMTGRGRRSDSYTIDRIDQERGYEVDNLQVLSNVDNIRKYLEYDWQTKTARVITSRTLDVPAEDLPF